MHYAIEEGDLLTSDYAKFYRDGMLVLQCVDEGPVWTFRPTRQSLWKELGRFGDDHIAAIRAYMDRDKFYPNVWFIDDHGNPELLKLDSK